MTRKDECFELHKDHILNKLEKYGLIWKSMPIEGTNKNTYYSFDINYVIMKCDKDKIDNLLKLKENNSELLIKILKQLL